MCEWQPYPIYRETLRALGHDNEFQPIHQIRVPSITDGAPWVIEGWYARD